MDSTAPQLEFHALQSKFSAFVGGYGSGKTETLCNQAIIDASHSPDTLISLYEPTFDLIRLVIAPRMIEKLDEYKIRHRWNKQENIIYTKHKQMGNFVLRSLERPERIIGFQSYRAHIDEFDTLKPEHAQLAWRKILGRNRQKPRGVKKPFNRCSVYTSPEGFKYVYNRFVKNKKPGYEMVQASSYSNPYLPEDYIESLLNDYPPQLVEAYVEGKFVNLTSGTVFNCYNRKMHDSKETIKEKETLYIGNDFNVTRMAATVYVRRDGGKQWHSVEELVDLYDTPDLCRVIKERWKDKGHHIVMYPDASGGSRSSKNGNVSDIAILRQHGFEIRVNSTNPSVKDRINATNAAFTKGLLYVNADRCPTVADCLEQQVYDKNGEPDKKSGNDHQNDATSYPVAYEMPILKPAIRHNVL
jgi:hypothetical protein